MTVNEIYQALGLEDPEVFRKKAVRLNARRLTATMPKSRERKSQIRTMGTGRTVRLVVTALSHLSRMENGVMYVGCESSHRCQRRMVVFARDWARKIGLDPDRVQAFRRNAELRGAPVFLDHYHD